MEKRWIKVEIDEKMGDDQFIDLAHAVWSVARVAVEDFSVSVDESSNVTAYNERWEEHGRIAPWT